MEQDVIADTFVGKMYRVSDTEYYALLIGIPHHYHLDQLKMFDQATLVNEDGSIGFTSDHGKVIRLRFSPQDSVKFKGNK